MGDWLIIERVPNVPEEELNKLKKAKGSKTLGLNDLNPIELRAWVNLEHFNTAGLTEQEMRANLENSDKTEEEFKVNVGEFYVKL